jgi:hypothetical protein
MTAADIPCAEALLQPARRVLKSGIHIRYDPFDRRVAIWNQIRANFDRYMNDECGIFLDSVDMYFRSSFDAALIALVVSFEDNNETFSAVEIFQPREIEIYRKIERYNLFEILSEKDVRNRIMQRDTGILDLLRDYYMTMSDYVESTLDDTEIRLSLRYYLKRRWKEYRGKVDSAVASAIIDMDWFRVLIREWDKKAENTSTTNARADDPRG